MAWIKERGLIVFFFGLVYEARTEINVAQRRDFSDELRVLKTMQTVPRLELPSRLRQYRHRNGHRCDPTWI
jgi:hypothetical protein